MTLWVLYQHCYSGIITMNTNRWSSCYVLVDFESQGSRKVILLVLILAKKIWAHGQLMVIYWDDLVFTFWGNLRLHTNLCPYHSLDQSNHSVSWSPWTAIELDSRDLRSLHGITGDFWQYYSKNCLKIPPSNPVEQNPFITKCHGHSPKTWFVPFWYIV